MSRLVQKASVYSNSEPQEHAVQCPFLRGALRPPVPPALFNPIGEILFSGFGALAGCLAFMEDMMYRLVQKASDYSISALQQHAVQFPVQFV